MDRNKKIFIFILIFLTAVIAAFLIYYFFFTSNTDAPVNPPPSSGTTFPTPPTGSGGNGTPPTSGGAPQTGGGSQTGVFKPILRQVTNVPTAGGVVFDKSGKSYIRYLERVKGNVYETEAASIKAVRLSNTTIPKIYEAFWNAAGGNVIARFLKDDGSIQTFSAAIAPKTGGEGELRGEFLANDIKNLAISPSGNQIFYLINNSGGASGIVASFDGRKKVGIFDSPLTEWLGNWPNENTVALTSKAGAGSRGLLIFINAGTGTQDIVLSEINGLTSLGSADLKKVLYSESDRGRFTARLLNVSDKSKGLFPLNTLPEKCVWSQVQKNIIYCAVPESIPSGSYPDDWYQGIVSFRDEIWKIDTSTGATTFIMNLGDQSRIDFDAVNLTLNAKENFLLLINKNDLTLWEVQLSQ